MFFGLILCRVLGIEPSGESMIEKAMFKAGIGLLRQPVLPLVSIVQFLYLTGDFTTPNEVIAALPEEIETGYALYRDPGRILGEWHDLLQPLVDLKAGIPPGVTVVDAGGQPLDAMTATTALVAQAVLTRELEAINSALCAPCGCTLCCVGPTRTMDQCFFEIPLAEAETGLFTAEQVETGLSRPVLLEEEPALWRQGRACYDRDTPVLLRWREGDASLVLSRETACPNLTGSGHCRVYADRPQVCRRPQIFAYVVEPVESQPPGQPMLRMRQSLLAVVDCPYVDLLRDEIAAYAAACELELILRRNKA